ncbi:ferrous iron transport protein A [Photobacterium sp. OFAV2-7]|uniref:FeoA family protein n=1 Tax=Photobacterium sp. OFAV2-7 TaxID=2917748 RepID=UPI001EF54983|nr:ferrous iron transport protein A [Photobacterium sp. OFAV2-7]MCG7585119.1 ferrous iron transport protein A [Photobacterium sp. OFAV2-7]
MTLNDTLPNQTVVVLRHHATGVIRQRLMDLGIMPQAQVTMVRSAPLGDPIEIKIDNTHVSLRRAEAAGIEVTSATPIETV